MHSTFMQTSRKRLPCTHIKCNWELWPTHESPVMMEVGERRGRTPTPHYRTREMIDWRPKRRPDQHRGLLSPWCPSFMTTAGARFAPQASTATSLPPLSHIRIFSDGPNVLRAPLINAAVGELWVLLNTYARWGGECVWGRGRESKACW